ncbi:MAG: iron-containing alcohol dehydrogenase [Nitrospirota bacterium]
MNTRPTRDPPWPSTPFAKGTLALGGLVLVAVLSAGISALAANDAVATGVQSEQLVPPAWVGNQWLRYDPDARIQEETGYRILALERDHSERLGLLANRWSDLSADASSFAKARGARLQEALGLSIATTAQRLYIERSALEAALAEHRATVAAVLSGGWFQERLGAAIAQTAAAIPPNDPRFLPRIEAERAKLSVFESRVANRAAEQIGVLNARLAQVPRESITRLADAIAEGRRVARFYDASVEAQFARDINQIQTEMTATRDARDYQAIAQAAEAAVRSPWSGRGFLEFGAAALLGAIGAMAWVALTTKADFPRVRDRITRPLTGKPSRLPRWKGRVARPRSTALSIWPREVIFGSHCTRDIGGYAGGEHASHVTILTDPDVARRGLVDPVTASLAEAGVRCDVMARVSREVPHAVVADIASWCKAAKTDLLVAVGGGSVIDTAKAVGIILTNGGSIQDYEGVDRVGLPITTLYAVPTTAGCGAETSPFCIVRDATRKRKFEIFSRALIPERVFIDPLMTRTMPPDLTASTGLDALANAVEAYFSTWANPLSDTLALDAIRLIGENLRAAVANGQNVHARQQMALAAFEAGQASVNARSGAVHALGHSLSGQFDLPERIGNAILLPHVMRAYLYADGRRMAKVAEMLGESVAGLNARAAAQRAIDAVTVLLMDVGLPTTLEQVGVDKHAISTLSVQAMEDPLLRANPQALKREDVEAIYEDAFIEYAEIEMEPSKQS